MAYVKRATAQAHFACIVAAMMCFAAAAVRAAPETDKPAPALVVTALDGQVFDLAKLKGKVALINYWATWCAPCRKDMPKLDAFYRRYHGQNLELIGISVDQPRDFTKVRKVMAALAYPVALRKDVSDDGFGPPQGVPITWIVDTEGTVRDYMIDVRDELLNGIVLPLLPH
jgi:cytochrome c biogenesis protein CcmG, thiol:disulfide interchange protein DsbE